MAKLKYRHILVHKNLILTIEILKSQIHKQHHEPPSLAIKTTIASYSYVLYALKIRQERTVTHKNPIG